MDRIPKTNNSVTVAEPSTNCCKGKRLKHSTCLLLLFLTFATFRFDSFAQERIARQGISGSSDFSGWKEVVPKGEGFSLRFPSVPDYVGPRAGMTSQGAYLLTTKDGTLYYLGIESDGPRDSDDGPYSKTLNSKMVTVGGCRAEESIKHLTILAGPSYYSRNRVLNAAKRRYVMQVVAKRTDYLFSAAANYFLDSFRLVDDYCRGIGTGGLPLPSPLSPREIVRNTLPSVVLLVMQDVNGKPLSFGTGFFVKPDLIATNYHVTKGTSRGYAKLVGKTTTYALLGIAAEDKERDLILLRIKGASSPSLPLQTSAQTQVGDEIYAVGNPEGFEGTFSQGIVSGIRQAGPGSVIQITAPISPGSSGGPVLNANGRVIGIAVASIKRGQNLNFAIPVSYLAALLMKVPAP